LIKLIKNFTETFIFETRADKAHQIQQKLSARNKHKLNDIKVSEPGALTL